MFGIFKLKGKKHPGALSAQAAQAKALQCPKPTPKTPASHSELLPLLIKPSYIKNSFDSIKTNSGYNRVIMAVGYPRIIREGWLNNIVASEGNFDLSMFISPSPIQSILTDLNRELVKQKSDMLAAEAKGIVNPSLKVQYEDTYRVLERLQTGEEKLFNFALYANARAQSESELELLSKKIESEMNSIMIIPKTPYLKMQDALKSILPVQNDKLNITRNMPSSALAACFPFTSSFLNLQENGVMFGLNKENNIPIILDIYQLTNYNGLILATSGSGKSFFSKLYAIRNILRGMKTIIIDPQGEYVDLCKAYGGQLVEISRESKTIINPLDLLEHDFGEKMLSLMDLFKVMCGELSEVQKNILDRALQKTYEQKGIIAGDKATWKKTPPILEDLHNVLVQESKYAGKMEKLTYDALINRIRIYAKGSFSFMNRLTNLDLKKDLISFNIVDMPPQIKPVMMFLVLDFVFKKMQKDKERKLIIVDEAWSLLRYGEHAEYLFELCKTARKFGTGLVIITQEVNDLLSSRAGNTILANTAWKLLLRQDPSVSAELSAKFNLNQEEQNFILTADIGEGLLLVMNSRIPIKIIASEKEQEIITTNPDVIREREKKLKEVEHKEVEDMSIYKLEKNFYPKNDLSKDQVKFLKEKEYIETKQLAGFDNKRGQRYMLKKPQNPKENIEHYFMVQLIAEECRKYIEKDAVVCYSSFGPDIAVQIPKGVLFEWVAFEVETRSAIKDKSQIEKKAASLNSKHFKEWYFVVAKDKLKKNYESFGKSLNRAEVPEKIKALLESKQKG